MPCGKERWAVETLTECRAGKVKAMGGGDTGDANRITVFPDCHRKLHPHGR
jgi:hypothetical protein